MTKNDKDWLKFLNPSTFYKNFILSSLFITAFDLLKTSIVGQVESFFKTEWEKDGLRVGEEYFTKVLSLDSKKDKLRASLAWLKEMEAIDDLDINIYKKITEHRNLLAHETLKILTDSEKEVDLELLFEIKKLLRKIDQWFILEIEIPTDPDMTDEDYKNIDRENVQSMSMIMLDYMIDSLFDPSEQTNEIYKEFAQKIDKEKNTNNF